MNALIISLIVLFLHATTWDGMIFENIKKLIKPEGNLYKPIYGCPICMTPWWGTLLYFIFFAPFSGLWDNSWLSIKPWLLTVGMASGLSVLWVAVLSARDFFVEYTNQLEAIRQEEKTS